jgi:hypothetical protein
VKRIALEGFTREDAFCWLATEARADGVSVMFHADGKKATTRHAVISIMGPQETADPVQFDQIITRGSLEVAA